MKGEREREDGREGGRGGEGKTRRGRRLKMEGEAVRYGGKRLGERRERDLNQTTEMDICRKG